MPACATPDAAAAGINLWDEHIPERTLVVLGGKDILSPAVHVDRWLREHTHAQVGLLTFRVRGCAGLICMITGRASTKLDLPVIMEGGACLFCGCFPLLVSWCLFIRVPHAKLSVMTAVKLRQR